MVSAGNFSCTDRYCRIIGVATNVCSSILFLSTEYHFLTIFISSVFIMRACGPNFFLMMLCRNNYHAVAYEPRFLRWEAIFNL